MLAFMVACFMALAGKHVASTCDVEISPPSVVVRFGDPLRANCAALTDQIQGMGWESSQGGKPLTTGVTSLALSIVAVTDWELRAFCFLNSLSGGQCMKPLAITVYKTPDNVVMSGISGPLVQGQPYQMRCDVFNVAPVNRLSVRWYKGGKIFNTAKFTDTTLNLVNKSSVLTLSAHREDHEQSIWCEAALNFGPGADIPASPSQAYKMEVQFPPAFSNATDEEHVLRDESPLLLNCTASGNPVPVYSWTFPHPIQLTIANQSAHQPVLMLLLKLPGVYTCSVLNSQGTATKSFNIIEPESSSRGPTAVVLLRVLFVVIFTLACVVLAETGDRTAFAAIVGAFVAAGISLILVGLYFLTPYGTFAFNKGSYERGRPTSSGPV